MPDTGERVMRATRDLRAIQQALQQAARAAPQDPEALQLVEELKPELINELKAEVDHMRHLLWAYMEAVSATGTTAGLGRSLQTVRMQRATELLRVLREQFTQPESRNTPEARSLLEEIGRIAESAVERATRKDDDDAQKSREPLAG